MKKYIKANDNLARSVYILILVSAIIGVTVTEGTLSETKCRGEIKYNGCKVCDKECKNFGGGLRYDSGKCDGSWFTGRHCMCHKKGNYCRPECFHEVHIRNCDYCEEDCQKRENGTLYNGGYCEGRSPFRHCMCHKIGEDCK